MNRCFLEPPNQLLLLVAQLLLLVALGGLIRLLYGANRGCGIFQKNSTELYGRNDSNTTGLEGLSVLSATAVNAALALDLHSRFGSICGPWRTNPDPVVGSDPS